MSKQKQIRNKSGFIVHTSMKQSIIVLILANILFYFWFYVPFSDGKERYFFQEDQIYMASMLILPVAVIYFVISVYYRFIKKRRLIIKSSYIYDLASPLSIGKIDKKDIDGIDIHNNFISKYMSGGTVVLYLKHESFPQLEKYDYEIKIHNLDISQRAENILLHYPI